MRRLLLLTFAIAGLVAAGCGSDAGSGKSGAGEGAASQTSATPETETTGADRQAETKGTTVKLADSQFGNIVFDGDGQAIYLFDKEKSDKSECYDKCAEEWPPVLTDGEPQADNGTDQDLLGTIKRDDGKSQVTYNGHPLYYYAHEDPGQVLCHNVTGFGGLWLVLDKAGDAVS